ncbi:MAG TPA: hypothetical protein DCL49_04205 [Candidatus Omnitrophica bacterium]|nr:MAG: hypothetical protein A2216_01450 [Omnitrophica WOR_2 bacterium RIFOXYA2_FULL_45_12]OGX61503.1 MAG: hypothetical protein A2471_01055 [Omnitrophica WOR_2 bacterium RIFOXYC2_FULL_45_15]HAH20090.1 hypothetical protein [Candidatus Omnitrophota bacterium]
MLKQIKNIFHYRWLIYAFLVRGFKAKYKNSFLGIFWSLLNPLLNVLIFSFVFTVIFKIGIKDYSLYLLCAVFPWNFFNSALINSVVSIVEDSSFVKNVYFPLEIVPLAVTAVNFVNFLIELTILLIFLAFLGKWPGGAILWFYIPVLAFIEFILVSGLAVLASGLFVIFRDLNFILNFFLRLFFYFVPVVYTLELVPPRWNFIYRLNPLAVIIDGFTRVFFFNAPPDIFRMGLALAESGIIFIFCFWAFNKMRMAIPERL